MAGTRLPWSALTACLLAGAVLCAGCRQRPRGGPLSRPAPAAPASQPARVWLPPAKAAIAPETQPAPLTTMPAAMTPWPMYRGGPDQRGLAPGRLGTNLVRLWRFQTHRAVESSPVVAEGKVFIGSNDGTVYAIDSANGRQVWAATTDGAVSAPPLYVGGRVYVGSQDNNLYCLSAARGRLIWKYATEGAIHAAAAWAPDGQGPDGRILVGSYDFSLHCVRASDGRKLWASETNYQLNTTPALADGRAVFGGCDGNLYALALADGKELAKVTLSTVEGYIPASAALVGAKAYAGDFQGRLAQVDLAAGKIDWAFERPKEPFFSSPAVTDERVIVGCQVGTPDASQTGMVYCLDRATGGKKWQFAAAGPVDSSPVVCDGKVVFGCSDGRLYVLRLSDGQPLWSIDLGDRIRSSPAVVDGKVIIGCDDGYVYCFGPKSGGGLTEEKHE